MLRSIEKVWDNSTEWLIVLKQTEWKPPWWGFQFKFQNMEDIYSEFSSQKNLLKAAGSAGYKLWKDAVICLHFQ